MCATSTTSYSCCHLDTWSIVASLPDVNQLKQHSNEQCCSLSRQERAFIWKPKFDPTLSPYCIPCDFCLAWWCSRSLGHQLMTSSSSQRIHVMSLREGLWNGHPRAEIDSTLLKKKGDTHTYTGAHPDLHTPTSNINTHIHSNYTRTHTHTHTHSLCPASDEKQS